jgi:beta-lactamase superfamily II metal-dependent hydrolase
VGTFVQDFFVHPVGQGLFYTGVFELKETDTSAPKKFTMPFDCGSINRSFCERAATAFRNEHLQGRHLDLLIISHFDNDHVSNIGTLLEGEIKIKKLAMPLISFSERLTLVLKRINDRTIKPSDDAKRLKES